MSLKTFLKNNSSNILTGIGVLGVIGTAYLAARATPKVVRLLDNTEYDKGEPLTKFEKVKIAAPAYIPAALVGTGTIVCIIGANILNRRQQASLISAYTLLDRSYKEYRNKIAELYGEETEKAIYEEVSKKECAKYVFEEYDDENFVLFYDINTRQYFEGPLEKVIMFDGLECFLIATP